MSLFTTFFIGFFAACLSLIAQVLVSTIAELFFRISLTFQYAQDNTLNNTIVIMFIAATIEEVIRYFAIKNTTLHHIKNIYSPMLYGFLFGSGFAGFETLLIYLNQSYFDIQNILMITPVYAIHIIASILFLYTIKPNAKIKHDIFYITFIVIFHVICNLAIFYNFSY